MDLNLVSCTVLMIVTLAHSLPDTYVKTMEMMNGRPIRKIPKNFILSYKPYDESWTSFKKIHEKVYESQAEHDRRYQVFLNNIAFIESHNKQFLAGKKSFYLGVNHFADWNLDEFRQYNGYRMSEYKERQGSSYVGASFTNLPDSVDWREKGYVTKVKNQGRCGSCWSFSATGSLEGQHFKLSKQLVSLSEQQLVDCSGGFGNHGCNGGLMDNAFAYVKTVGGIDTEKYYPYEAHQEQHCNFSRKAVAATCTGFVDVPHDSEDQLKEATATVGPISVAIDASHRSFQLYMSGVYDEPECSPVRLDHGVLVVGYGTSEEGDDYWIVKNSWGPQWGEEGYVLMSRNKSNQCGIASQGSYPLV